MALSPSFSNDPCTISNGSDYDIRSIWNHGNGDNWDRLTACEESILDMVNKMVQAFIT